MDAIERRRYSDLRTTAGLHGAKLPPVEELMPPEAVSKEQEDLMHAELLKAQERKRKELGRNE
jgi:hypothetical protein